MRVVLVPPYSPPPGSVDRIAPEAAAVPGFVHGSRRDRRTRFNVAPCTFVIPPPTPERAAPSRSFRARRPPVRPPSWRGVHRGVRVAGYGRIRDAATPRAGRRRSPRAYAHVLCRSRHSAPSGRWRSHGWVVVLVGHGGGRHGGGPFPRVSRSGSKRRGTDRPPSHAARAPRYAMAVP